MSFKAYRLSGDLAAAKQCVDQEITDDLFMSVCINGHLTIAKWLYDQINGQHMFSIFSKVYIDFKSVFATMCYYGYLDILKWLLNIKPTIINISSNYYYYLENACGNAHLETAKWLFSIKQINISDIESFDDENIFCIACYNGHLEIAKWLISINPTMNISIQNEHAFKNACKQGHLEVAKWLLSINPTIDISNDNDFVFRVACENGHLEIVKWLLSIKPTIDIRYGCCYACHHNKIQVLNFLLNLRHIKHFVLYTYYYDDIKEILFKYGYYKESIAEKYSTPQTEIIRTLNLDIATYYDLTTNDFFIAKYMINFGYTSDILDKVIDNNLFLIREQKLKRGKLKHLTNSLIEEDKIPNHLK